MDGHYIAKGRITVMVKVRKPVWVKGKSLDVKKLNATFFQSAFLPV